MELQRPSVEPIDSRHYVLKEPFTVQYNGTAITVPQGYVTNGADIPRFFWRMFPPFSPEYIPAVIVHDYLCDKAFENGNDKEMYLHADKVFKHVLKAYGVPSYKVFAFYNAVRLHHKIRY